MSQVVCKTLFYLFFLAQKDGIGPYGRKSVKAFYDMIHESECEVRIQQSVGTKVQHSLPAGSLKFLNLFRQFWQKKIVSTVSS